MVECWANETKELNIRLDWDNVFFLLLALERVFSERFLMRWIRIGYQILLNEISYSCPDFITVCFPLQNYHFWTFFAAERLAMNLMVFAKFAVTALFKIQNLKIQSMNSSSTFSKKNIKFQTKFVWLI